MRHLISVACEGFLDRVILERLLREHGLEAGPIYDKGGKQRLDARLAGYVQAARFSPWIVQRDLDHDAACAPDLVGRLVPDPPAGLCLIVAVRQMEAWLLADRKSMAAHLRIAESKVPRNPEVLPDAKGVLIELARWSRARDVRAEMVPDPGSGRRVGIGYTARMQAFVQQDRNFRRAAAAAPSLATLVGRLERFRQTAAWQRTVAE